MTLAPALQSVCDQLDGILDRNPHLFSPKPRMNVSTVVAVVPITADHTTIEVHEVTGPTTDHVELVTADGHHLLTLNDQDMSLLITTMTTVWRERLAARLATLQETP